MFIFSNLNLLYSSLTLCYFGVCISSVMNMRSKNTVCLFQDVSRIVPKASQATVVFAVGFPVSCPFPVKREVFFYALFGLPLGKMKLLHLF